MLPEDDCTATSRSLIRPLQNDQSLNFSRVALFKIEIWMEGCVLISKPAETVKLLVVKNIEFSTNKAESSMAVARADNVLVLNSIKA